MATTRKPRAKATAPEPEEEEAGGCRVPGCPRGTEWRGLCAAHRMTHRGLAAPVDDEQETSGG